MYRAKITYKSKKGIVKDTSLKALKEDLEKIKQAKPEWKIGKIQKIKSAEEIFKEWKNTGIDI